MTTPIFNKTINQGYVNSSGYYSVTTGFTGASIGDILEKTIIIDVSSTGFNETKASPIAIYYTNLTTGLMLQDSEVSAANISYIQPSSSAGSATAANQTLEIAALNSILGNQTNGTQHTIVDSSALPTGASTSANQTTANTSLSTIATNTSAALGTVSKAAAPVNTIVGGVVYSSASITLTDQQTIALQSDVNGKLLISTPFSTFPATVVLTQALTNTAFQIKSSSGRVVGWNFINPNATVVYIKFYNALAVNVTVGTTTPVKTLFIPATSTIFVPNHVMVQHNFTTAISIAVVTGIADSDNTAPVTNCYGEVHYA